MKRLLSTILLTVLFCMFGPKAHAYDIEVANADGVTIYYNYINNGTELEVTRYNFNTSSYSGAVVIPDEVTYNNSTLKVTSIGYSAFNKCSSLTSITIPNSVTNIGEQAFSECSSLASITIPNSVMSIGYSAFSRCIGLTSVTIGNGVTSIGFEAFYGCSGLESIKVEIGNIVYDSRNDCNAIIRTETNELLCGCKKTTIPNSVTSIGNYAFSYCSSLTSITIPNGVKAIKEGAFWYCSGLTSVTIGNGVTSIGFEAFYGCSGLTAVTIGNSVTSIGREAFYGCSGLASISIPNSVTIIEGRAFQDCRIENVLTKNAKTESSNAFSDRTYQHAMLYIPEGTWAEAVYDGDWYMFNNIRETTMQVDALSPRQVYTLMDTKNFGYAVYDETNDKVKMVKAFYSINEQDLNNCWTVQTQAGKKFLYNVGAQKFATISSDGRITLTTNLTPIEFDESEDGIILGSNLTRQWCFVKNDSQSDVNGIIPLASDNGQLVNSYYSIDGQHTSSPQNGIYIVRMSDGTTKKVVVK